MPKRSVVALLLGLVVLSLCSCRTLDSGASGVQVAERAGDKCKNLGPVNVEWSWWGSSTEVLNVMRNQVAEKGGNLLVQTAEVMGVAYRCPE